MSDDKGMISVRQAMIMIVILFATPAIRYIPIYTATKAKNAAWLSPIVGLAFGLIYLFVWSRLYKKYAKQSYIDIIKDVMGKTLGQVIVALYFVWVTLLLAYNVRMYTERILAIAMPNVSIYIVLGLMLLLVWYVVKNGIIPLSKMCEIFFMLLALVFIIYSFLILPYIDTKNFIPITYKDILPVFDAGVSILAIFAYNILVFIFNDKIDEKGEMKKYGFKSVVYMTLISLAVIIIPLGTFGWSTLIKMPIPFFNSMMQIFLFNTIERLESGLIIFWIVSDFVLIVIFVYSAIHIVRLSFNISNVKPLTMIYIKVCFS